MINSTSCIYDKPIESQSVSRKVVKIYWKHILRWWWGGSVSGRPSFILFREDWGTVLKSQYIVKMMKYIFMCWQKYIKLHKETYVHTFSDISRNISKGEFALAKRLYYHGEGEKYINFRKCVQRYVSEKEIHPWVVVFLPDDPSYSPGEGEEGVILYAPFIRGGVDTYIGTDNKMPLSSQEGVRKKGIFLVSLAERVSTPFPIMLDDLFWNNGNSSLS